MSSPAPPPFRAHITPAPGATPLPLDRTRRDSPRPTPAIRLLGVRFHPDIGHSQLVSYSHPLSRLPRILLRAGRCVDRYFHRCSEGRAMLCMPTSAPPARPTPPLRCCAPLTLRTPYRHANILQDIPATSLKPFLLPFIKLVNAAANAPTAHATPRLATPPHAPYRRSPWHTFSVRHPLGRIPLRKQPPLFPTQLDFPAAQKQSAPNAPDGKAMPSLRNAPLADINDT